MIPFLLLVIPVIGGLVGFFIKDARNARTWSLLVSLAVLVASLLGLLILNKPANLQFSAEWLPMLGSRFSLMMDGMSQVLCLLTALAFPIIFIATYNNQYRNAKNFYALMLLSQAGLIGVFIASDALLFYFFWELALIPAYFLCSIWGGEKRIAVTFKFFIYTFVGSLLMLVALVYVYLRTPDHSFALESFYNTKLDHGTQNWLFWLFFIAFAIKMPIFPLHTWQPDTYEQAPTAVTMVLSGVMVKMGVFGILRWVIPVVPSGLWAWGDTISSLAVIGMIYASLVALVQDDLKRFVAYSSIAHMGLMCLAIFATTNSGMQGVMIQMFNHGINIIGLWIVVNQIEQQFGTRKMSELGGLAQKAPTLSILLVIIALANIALPLTNAFVGEFMMFTGIFTSAATQYSVALTVAAGVSIILSAWYTLNMIQKVFFGNTNTLTVTAKEMGAEGRFALIVLVILIVLIGLYPSLVLNITKSTSEFILSKMFTQ
ncbi:MAG TPA: NADH-quinone oxidoreductase subunit M [Chitinophagaceae bacterium]|nr:NADH-quinone oxidoreductase subunit M [Chitinophagaceae bacterium]